MTREVELLFELQKARDQCSDTLTMRQRLAEDLRRRVDRAGAMNDDEKAALRADIKVSNKVLVLPLLPLLENLFVNKGSDILQYIAPAALRSYIMVHKGTLFILTNIIS